MVRTQSVPHGLQPTNVLCILAQRGETTTASDFAKRNHYAIAVLSSIGLITCLTRSGDPTSVWRVTFAGHHYIERNLL